MIINSWISVSDELPSLNQKVIVCVKNPSGSRFTRFAIRRTDTVRFKDGREFWQIIQDCCGAKSYEDGITHWMSEPGLPEET
jgi:hypothetical protein